jgi:tetratricopeptide (TPR) repeat protein
MKTAAKSVLLILLFLSPYILPLLSTIAAQQGGKINWMDGNWRVWDVNADGKFDKQDIEKLLDDGWQTFSTDINHDGKKDLGDVFALYVKLTVLDRNCDEVVDDDDFLPAVKVQIPESDAGKVFLIVNELVAKNRVHPDAGLPADVDEKIFGSIEESWTLSAAERGYVYQAAGLSALMQRNLKAAQWAFGRSVQTYGNSATALGNLAFSLCLDERFTDALTLLVHAKEIFPHSAATAATMGWIAARHGQDTEALRYYSEAVTYAPDIAQYHMNLGITYLRLGRIDEAVKQFAESSDKNPGDFRATIFRYTVPKVDPPFENPPIDPEEFKKEYEEQLEEMDDEDFEEDEIPDPWYKLSQCDQTKVIMECLENRYTLEMNKYLQNNSNSVTVRLNQIKSPFLPQWKNCRDDFERWNRGVKIVLEESVRLSENAKEASGRNWARLRMAWGNELLGYSSFFMEGALKQANSESNRRYAEASSLIRDFPGISEQLSRLKSEIYQDALKESLNQCYYPAVRKAMELLRSDIRPMPLVKSEVEDIPFGPGTYTEIVLAALSLEGYCNTGADGLTPAAEIGLPAVTLGFDWGFIEFEWNITTGELELNFGQGLIFGATWSPEAGFGVQVGVGVDIDIGPIEAKAGVYIKVDSKFNIKAESEALIHTKGKLAGKDSGFSLGGSWQFFQLNPLL